jgi:hypothetical protein
MMIKEISDFLSNEGGRDLTDEQIEAYIKTGTILVARTHEKIICVCLFSVHGSVAHVHEVAVDKDHRFQKVLKWIAIKGLNKFPFLNEVVFERDRKYPDRKPSKYDIYKLIGIKKKQEV